MAKEPIDIIIDEVKRDLENHKPPKVRYDKNNQDIRVTYDFGLGYIPRVKIKAVPEQWLEWWANFDNLTFEDIRPYIRSQKKQELIEEYGRKDPCSFQGDLFTCVEAAFSSKPPYRGNAKARGYDKTAFQLAEIKIASGHLYVYLQYYQDNPQKEQPVKLNALLEKYGLNESDLPDLSFVTLDIIEQAYNCIFLSFDLTKEFFTPTR